MNMKKRHYHARLCQKYVEHFDLESFKTLWEATENNYKTEFSRPSLTQGRIFELFLKAKQEKEGSV
jgi:hypothetical protein